MKKFFRIVITLIIVLLLSLSLYKFWPYLSARLFSNSSSQWISQKISESIQAQNELLVLDIETTRQETITQEAWLIGTVQKVDIPYTFSMHYSVDMTKVQVNVNGTAIRITVPEPQPGYQKLTVDEDHMQKSDFLMPLTATDYAKMKQELEDKLYQEYASSAACLEQARDNTTEALKTQYSAVLDKLFTNQVNPYTVTIEFSAAEK